MLLCSIAFSIKLLKQTDKTTEKTTIEIKYCASIFNFIISRIGDRLYLLKYINRTKCWFYSIISDRVITNRYLCVTNNLF